MTIGAIILTTWFIGFVVGFMAYHATRVGVHEYRIYKNEQKNSLESGNSDKANTIIK